jgi:glycosyltransferase involved in cell wall biosynthesis
MTHRLLTALPVFNEEAHVAAVVREVRLYSPEVLLVDDGSSDGTASLLERMRREAPRGFHIVRHARNRGYGAALQTAFDFALGGGYEVLVTIDCDGQHEPQRIPRFAAAAADADIVSGSRYLKRYPGDTPAPEERRRINRLITAELNRRLGLTLTDAFCGFKAYRVAALARLSLTETGYAMPLELWVQAVRAGLTICELPVPLIYLDEKRSFGGALDDGARRLAHYREVIDRAIAAAWLVEGRQPAPSCCGESAG